MKRFFLFLTLAALCAACNDDKTPEITPDPPTPPDPAKPTLTITMSDITATSATMTVVPSSNDVAYLNNIISEAIFAKHHHSDVATFISNLLSDTDYWGDKSVAEIVAENTVTGKNIYQPDKLTPNTDYVAFAVGLDKDGGLTTEPVTMKFKTEELDARITFQLNVLKQEWDNVDFEIIPSNDEDYYYYTIKPLSFCSTRTDEELLNVLVSENGFLMDFMSVQGTTTIVRTEDETPYTYYNPDTGYQMLVVGYDLNAHMISTKLSRFDIRTSKPEGNPAACTFDTAVTDIGSRSATVTIVPSDPQLTYAWDLMDAELYETYKNKLDEFVSAYVDEVGIDQLEDDVRAYGEQGNMFINVLEPNTTYYVWAVCMDENGKPTSDVRISDPFMTLETIVSSATVTVTIEKYFNGDEVYAIDPDTYALSKGMAYVPVTFKASDDAKSWFGGLFEDDMDDYGDWEIIESLSTNFEYAFPTGKLYNCNWDQPYTIIAFAQDKENNYSKVYRRIVTFTKESAAPISEFTAPESAPGKPAFLSEPFTAAKQVQRFKFPAAE